MIKSKTIRWAGHVALMHGEEECMKDIDEKARRKETTGKTKMLVGG
jgi:hypothetical protein